MNDEPTFTFKDKFWMVVNVSECVENKRGYEVLPNRRPKFIHDTKEDAEAEAIRLHQLGRRFVVLESIAFTESRPNWVITEPQNIAVLESFDRLTPKPFKKAKKPNSIRAQKAH